MIFSKGMSTFNLMQSKVKDDMILGDFTSFGQSESWNAHKLAEKIVF